MVKLNIIETFQYQFGHAYSKDTCTIRKESPESTISRVLSQEFVTSSQNIRKGHDKHNKGLAQGVLINTVLMMRKPFFFRCAVNPSHISWLKVKNSALITPSPMSEKRTQGRGLNHGKIHQLER